ncbi:Ribonuclease HII [Dermatophilus congolensis]|uniref:Ribonuclease HII n=2 Tax=Dermatophilus congolensis TaxID=1863 RepID=A0A239VES3_9MICO|nr:Ribonuclease HII [Dermatophilus congolensis]
MTRLTSPAPTLRLERSQMRQGAALVAGMDEVGRGALAGPVSVGVCVVDANTRSAPVGLRDSKLISPTVRERLVEPIHRWACAWAVGHAEPEEIDEHGIMAALRLAGRRALTACGVIPDVVILDGKHDWLTDPSTVGLFAALPTDVEDASVCRSVPPVVTVVKGDRTCSSVAAASVLAKVERDGIMVERSAKHPVYGWDVNKGYASAAHRAALGRMGVSEQHRRSWNLGTCPTGVVGSDGAVVPEGQTSVAGCGTLPQRGAQSPDHT